MNDPLSSLTVPPPRYLLESDSSDEEGQGLYSSSSTRPRKSPPVPSVSIQWEDASAQGSSTSNAGEILVGVGQAGRYLTRKTGLRGKRPELRVEVSEGGKKRTVGEGWRLGSEWLLAVREEWSHQVVWKVAEALMSSMKARRW